MTRRVVLAVVALVAISGVAYALGKLMSASSDGGCIGCGLVILAGIALGVAVAVSIVTRR